VAIEVDDVVDRGDVRTVERREGLRLALEAGAKIGSSIPQIGRIFRATSRFSRVSRAR